MDTIGKRIVSLMNKTNINSNQLAKLVGISQPGISKYLKDISIPTADTLGKIAIALDTSVDYLIFGTEEYKDTIEEQLLTAFRNLNYDNKVQAIGEITKMLTIQQINENNKKD